MLLICHLMISDNDMYSLGRDSIILLKNITTLSLVKLFEEDGQSFTAENTYVRKKLLDL